jgi:hypothetical protein
MQHLITMPKSLGGSKAERKARIQTNGQTAMIDTADMLRVTGMKPIELLQTMPEFHLTARLAKAERDWAYKTGSFRQNGARSRAAFRSVLRMPTESM